MTHKLISLLLMVASGQIGCRPINRSATLKEDVPEQQPSGRLKPVLVIKEHGNITKELRSALFAGAGEAAKRAAMRVARDVRTGAFSPSLALPLQSVKRLDEELAAAATGTSDPLHHLLQRNSADMGIELKLLLVDFDTATTGGSTSVTEGEVENLAIFLQLVSPSLPSERAMDIASLIRAPVFATEKEAELAVKNAEAYRRIAAERPRSWVVMAAGLALELKGGELKLRFNAGMKPADASQLVNQTSGAIGVSMLEYRPQNAASAPEPAAAGLKVDRTYRASSDTPDFGIKAKFTFGAFDPTDALTPAQCGANCLAEGQLNNIGRYYPTIRGYFNINQAKNTAMQVIAAEFEKWNHLNILLREVGFDFTDPLRPRVTPELSSFAMILGNGLVQLSQEKNVAFRGFDVYNGILASKIADKLNDKVKIQLRDANQSSLVAFAKLGQQLSLVLSGGNPQQKAGGNHVIGHVGLGEMCLDMTRDFADRNSFAYAFACTADGPGQFVQMPDRTLTLVNSGLCLDIDFNKTYTHAQGLRYRTYLDACKAGGTQAWTLKEIDLGDVKVKRLVSDWPGQNAFGQLCLTTNPSSRSFEGVNQGAFEVFAEPCRAENSINQVWEIGAYRAPQAP